MRQKNKELPDPVIIFLSHIFLSNLLPLPPELGRLFEQARRNLLWFNENVERLEVYKRYRGKYVAAAGGELFVADTAEEVELLAHERYPDDMPHVRYIPREKRNRINDC